MISRHDWLHDYAATMGTTRLQEIVASLAERVDAPGLRKAANLLAVVVGAPGLREIVDSLANSLDGCEIEALFQREMIGSNYYQETP